MNYRKDKGRGDASPREGKTLPKKVRVLLNLALVIGALLTLSLIVFGVSKSGYLNIERYRIKGNSFLTEEEIFALSGVELETNLYSLNMGTVEDTLENDPRIGSAVVRRRFPDTVIIEVDEIRPVALVNIEGSLYKVDGKGTIVAPLNGQYEDLPYLYGFETEIGGDNPVGKKISGRRVGSGLNAASRLAEHPVLAVEVDAIRVDKEVMYLGGSASVRYDESLTEKQVSRLARIWGILPKDDMTYEIDVRYGNDVIVKGL